MSYGVHYDIQPLILLDINSKDLDFICHSYFYLLLIVHICVLFSSYAMFNCFCGIYKWHDMYLVMFQDISYNYSSIYSCGVIFSFGYIISKATFTSMD